MKIRRSIFWFIAIMAVLIALVLWFRKKQPGETPAAAPTETNTVSVAATTPGQPVSAPVPTTAPPAQVAANAAAPSRPDKGEQIKEGLATLNDVPIAFYGRLEDQFGSPVVGAQIAAGIRIYNGVQSTVEHLTAVSDANGMFQIKDGQGESLGVMPKKEGYVLATTGTYFKYSYMYADHFTPDPSNPTVIKMWKLQGAEPLVGINQNYKLHYTNTPINFDLLTGKIVPAGGDLKITVNRPGGIISQQHPQNWNIQAEVIDGGFIITSVAESRITYSAPESGYESNGTFANNNGTDVVDQMFFLQSRNGQVYSKVRFSFRINDAADGIMYVTFSGVANTNGSRNWEATVP
jgi:hypothetical protein